MPSAISLVTSLAGVGLYQEWHVLSHPIGRYRLAAEGFVGIGGMSGMCLGARYRKFDSGLLMAYSRPHVRILPNVNAARRTGACFFRPLFLPAHRLKNPQPLYAFTFRRWFSQQVFSEIAGGHFFQGFLSSSLSPAGPFSSPPASCHEYLRSQAKYRDRV